MRKYIYCLIALISIVLTACDLNRSTNNTPRILFVTSPRLNANDTLTIHYTDEGGVIRLDTISVGDTVSFRIFLDGISNHLSSYYITQSDTSSTKILLPGKSSMDSIFISTSSDYSNGKFIFKSNVLNLYFPFKFVALKATNNAKISFSLTSDAVFDSGISLTGGNNLVSFVLKTPIKIPKSKPVAN